MNDSLIESAKEIEALREKVAEWERGDRQYPQAVQDYKDLCVELKRTQFDLAAMTQERDLKDSQVTKLYSNWTEAQSRIKELREALEMCAGFNDHEWTETQSNIIIDILATPDDSSALDAALKAEREQIAKHYDTTMPSVSQHIRSLK